MNCARDFAVGLILVGLVLGTAGCNGPAPTPPPAQNTPSTAAATPGADAGKPAAPASAEKPAAEAVPATWPDAPEIPFVPIMTEVEGIKIPRITDLPEYKGLSAKLPLDVGNPDAAKTPSTPVEGDWLIIRLGAEPQSLNGMVETSAYQTYITSYVNEGLARQDPETMKWEPHIASKWVVEDSVKLGPDYPGRERRIVLKAGVPSKELKITVAKKEDKFDFRTSGGDGKPAGSTWVGIVALEKILGAPPNGYHDWSNANGEVSFSGLLPGKYKVLVGDEIAGKVTRGADGSIEVAPAPENPHNPLVKELADKKVPTLKLAKGEWQDIQEQTIFTYFLRDDVKWSDGTPFTTKDVLFAYHLINNPVVDCDSLRVYYQDLVTCEAINPQVIKMKYRQQYFHAFEFTVGLSGYAPPRHQFEAHFKKEGITVTDERLTADQEKEQKKISIHGQKFAQFFNKDPEYAEKPMGTGQYIVDRWVRNNRVELVRNPNYWNKKYAGHLDKLIFRFIPDNVAAMQALKVGEVDFIWPITPEQYFEELEQPAQKEWFDKSYVKASWNPPGCVTAGGTCCDRCSRIAASGLP
ncbi:MAG: ABC transporter substrate-binding protein [Planctomycetales bacterium]